QSLEVPELLGHEDFHDRRRRVIAKRRDVVDRACCSVALAARRADEGRFRARGGGALSGRGASKCGRPEGGKAPDDQSDEHDTGEACRALGSRPNKTPNGHNCSLLPEFPGTPASREATPFGIRIT